jgi:hypothetical protein
MVRFIALSFDHNDNDFDYSNKNALRCVRKCILLWRYSIARVCRRVTVVKEHGRFVEFRRVV